MPCGGIYPLTREKSEKCFHCRKNGAKHFCLEWDCFLHAKCIPEFLMSEEGKIVMEHGHYVEIDFNLEKKSRKEN